MTSPWLLNLRKADRVPESAGPEKNWGNNLKYISITVLAVLYIFADTLANIFTDLKCKPGVFRKLLKSW